MREPTPRQLQVLRLVGEAARRGAPPPTLRELADALGLRQKTGVAEHLERLERKGLIRTGYSKARHVTLTETGWLACNFPPDSRPELLETLYRAVIAYGNAEVGQEAVLDASKAIQEYDGVRPLEVAS